MSFRTSSWTSHRLRVGRTYESTLSDQADSLFGGSDFHSFGIVPYGMNVAVRSGESNGESSAWTRARPWKDRLAQVHLGMKYCMGVLCPRLVSWMKDGCLV